MELIDLIIFPIILLLFTSFMYLVRQRQPKEIRRYFFPAYFAKIAGGFALGLIYMYYYGNGDTTAYFKVANVLNEGLRDSLSTWFRLIFGDVNAPDLLPYTSRMSRYTGGSELFIVRITAICSLLSFKSYYSTMIWFATFSFVGTWLMFKTLIRWYSGITIWLSMAIFFIPSVVFWGSGLMKDTMVLGCLGFLIYGIGNFNSRNKWSGSIIILLSFWLLMQIREFMLPVLVLPLGIALLFKYTINVKNFAIRGLAIIAGVGLIISGIGAYLNTFTNQLADFAKEAQISSDYLYRVSIAKEGSAYSIGTVDGTLQNLFELAPAAIWVSLFRPYPWEANNIVMLFTALENLTLLLGTIIVLLRVGVFGTLRTVLKDSYLQYAIIFCTFFAFVTGITTFNFGSLARYRIPILPFLVTSLVIILHTHKQMSKKNK